MSYVVTVMVCISAGFIGGILFGYGIGRERGHDEGFAKGVKRASTSKYL